jgi:hypothetical protein
MAPAHPSQAPHNLLVVRDQTPEWIICAQPRRDPASQQAVVFGDPRDAGQEWMHIL